MPETGVDAGPRNDQPGTAPVERKAMTAPDLPRPVHPPHPVDPRLERNKRVVRRFFEHFAAGAVPAAIALFRSDATYWFPTTRRDYTMPDFADRLEWIKSRLAGPIAFELGPMVAEGDAVSVLVESFARTAEGVPFNNLYNIYLELEGGKIRKAREYNDTAHVFATLRAGQSAS